MSKNYELLCACQKGLEIFQTQIPAPNRDKGYIAKYLNGKRRIRKEILKLTEHVFLTGLPSAPHSVAFSAVDHGAGSSWVCAHVAEALAAQIEGTVCLIDANPHAQSLERFFGISRMDSPEDKIAQPEIGKGSAQSIDGSNLWLLSGAAAPSPSSGSRDPRRLKAGLLELCAHFSFVILDAPPVSESADALTLGRITDGVILVLAAHSTHRAAALKAKQSLEAANIRLLGAVLNKRTYPIPDVLYKRL